jgi:putative ABC transport system permease protein
VDRGRLVDDLRAALPHNAKVQTAEQNARESANEINNAIGGFLTPALLAFSGAALLVGAFIIFNTFSITVAQRQREFAVLRSLGATRRQVLGAVTTEALILGLGASMIGVIAGIGFARLMSSVFDAVGFGIPRSGTVLEPRTVIVAIAVGLAVTLVAALAPALRATRVPPVLALAEQAPEPTRRSRRWTAAIAALLSAGGVVLLLSGLFGGGPATARLGSIAGGAVLIFIGVALSARYIVRPLASLVGLPIEALFRTPGRLARENAMRNPARTAVTSAALMVGLGLVVFVAVFAAGLKSSFSSQLDKVIKAEIFIYSPSFTPIPARTEHEIGGVSGVGTLTSLLFDQIEVDGHSSNTLYDLMLGVNPHKLAHAYTFDWVEGSNALLGRLGRNEAFVEEQFAKAHKVGVGDSYRVVTPSGGHARITAIGIYRDPTILQGTIADTRTLRAISTARDPSALFVSVAPGAGPSAVQRRVEHALKRFPEVTVDNRAEYKQYLDKQLNQIVYLVYALLAMSVIVSLFGIANSLFLTIHERTREFGLLRAVGATASQLRRVVRYESVITAVIGGLLGTVLGIAFASLTIASLSEFGLGFRLPVGQLVVFAILAVVVGVIGAIGPARRGSRVDVLEAIHHE